MSLAKFQVTAVLADEQTISHVIRAENPGVAKARMQATYPGCTVIKELALAAPVKAPAIKPKRLTKAERAQRELAVILRGRGYAMADIADALKISLDEALALLEAAQ